MAIENCDLLMFARMVTALIIVAIVVIYIIHYRRKRSYQTWFTSLEDKANVARQDFEALFVPSHLVEEKQIVEFNEKISDFLSDIDRLKQHKYYNEEAFSKSVIQFFLYALADSKSLMDKNNEIYYAIEELNNAVAQINARYQDFIIPTHYITYSEMEDFLKSSASIKEKVDKVFPQYAEYVSDENVKSLPALFENIGQVRTQHNNTFIRTELETNKVYFDHVLGEYPLDPQQRDSIVKLEDNCLVIASAGSGKTSTIVGKAKYLVEKQHIAPNKILLLTYTKKAANELAERMNIEGLNSGTFHSLAYRIIAEVTGMAPSICEADVPLNVFRKLILEDETSYTT